MKRVSQVKTGVLISYILIIMNSLYGILVTPFIIHCLGSADYGVYKTMSSLTSSLMVIDLGIGGTVQRFVAKYRADKEDKKIPNFLALNFIQAGLLCGVIAIVCTVVFFFLEPAYGNSFSASQLYTAKQVYVILAINMLVHVMSNVVNGIIVGCNQFIFGNGIKLIRLLLRIGFVLAFLGIFKSALTLVLIDLCLTVLFLSAQLLYVKVKLKIRIKFEYWDKSVFLESGKYTMLMFLTTIVAQVNSNLDNILIGSLAGPTCVAVYSIGLMFFGMFQNISGAVSGVMLPTVTNILAERNSEEKLINTIIKAGRFQFTLLGAAIVGFACIGKDFVYVWMGEGFEDVYIITLLLLVPAIFELCINVCLSILRAKNMLGFRTVALCVSTLVNIVITVVLIKYWSYVGAAIGTAASYVICSLCAMNYYYSKKLLLPMLRIYKGIVKGIWICLLISGVGLFVSSRYFNGSYVAIVIDIMVFCVLYVLSLLTIGLSRDEKEQIPIVNRFIRKKGE